MNDVKDRALEVLNELHATIDYSDYCTVFEGLTDIETLRDRDKILENLWEQFADVPMDPENERIEEQFLGFPAGTDRMEIWRWFDERYSKGITFLLYGYPCWEKEIDTLYEYVKKEIPYRLEEGFGLADLDKEIIQECVDAFWSDTDIISLMNDRMDEHIRQVLDDHCIEYED